MQLTKKSISNYQDAFSKAAELAKKNSDNTLFFSPKQKINKNSPSHDSNLFDWVLYLIIWLLKILVLFVHS